MKLLIHLIFSAKSHSKCSLIVYLNIDASFAGIGVFESRNIGLGSSNLYPRANWRLCLLV